MKAFPIDVNTASIEKWQGMDLRDYFAAKAMPAMFIEGCFLFDAESYAELAQHAYKMADAMMKARESK